MNKKHIILAAVLSLISISTYAQVAMGKWRTHFAYNTVSQIEQSENKVFAVSEGKLFSVDKRDDSMQLYSKITGLNGTTIGRIAYDEANKVLLIIYTDGNIDFLTADGIKNLPDFRNKQMSVNKEINHIFFHDNKAYLSANFGIMVLNMLKMEIRDTYYIGSNANEVQVLNTTYHQSHLYAASTDAIYKADANNPQLINYEFWKKMNDLPGSGNIQSIHSFGDWLILLRGNRLYKQDSSGTWTSLEPALSYSSIFITNDYLIGNSFEEGTYIYDKNFGKILVTGISNILDGKYDKSSSTFWFAGNSQGVVKYISDGTANFYKPDGPAVNIPFQMKFGGDRLFVVQGGRWATEYERPGVLMVFENNTWQNIESSAITQHTNKIARDFMDIAIDPTDNKHFFISSYGTGIFEFRNDEFFKWHNFENSTIETIFPNNPTASYLYMRTDGGTYDSQGNIWFSNSGTINAFQVYTKDGKWAKFGNQKISKLPTAGKVLISNQNGNQKWLLSQRHTPGVIVFDDNGTLDTKNDDRYVFLNSFNYVANNEVKNFSPTIFYSMAQDKNGAIWVGTINGPFVINNPAKAFDDDFMINRVIIPRNDGTGLGDFLLEDQEIYVIAVDGANRKWIGTRASGVYLMSENGQETIKHFTTENSPLLSDEINSIAIHPITGEVFIGTSVGLISYQSDAALAEDSFKNVHAYPNPVRENFTGVITIAGLMENTIVKIVDTAGNLVCQTTSNGSIATWDGKNGFGQKVSSGVYVAICTTPNGEQSATTKILIIN